MADGSKRSTAPQACLVATASESCGQLGSHPARWPARARPARPLEQVQQAIQPWQRGAHAQIVQQGAEAQVIRGRGEVPERRRDLEQVARAGGVRAEIVAERAGKVVIEHTAFK